MVWSKCVNGVVPIDLLLFDALVVRILLLEVMLLYWSLI